MESPSFVSPNLSQTRLYAPAFIIDLFGSKRYSAPATSPSLPGKTARAVFSSLLLNENVLPPQLAYSLHSPSRSLSSTTSNSLHSPADEMICISLHTPPSLSTIIEISAIGESFTTTCPDISSSSSLSASTSGRQSSIIKTFFPSSALLAGSRNMTSGEKSTSSSSTVAQDRCRSLPQALLLHTQKLHTSTFPIPSILKLCTAASARAGFISL